MQFNETNINDLYQSTVDAFPHTRKRQHATGPVQISGVNFTPYIGMKTLYIRALAQNEGREYNQQILFRNVIYRENAPLEIIDQIGKHYFLEELDLEKDILVRCSCPDFYWRFCHYNSLDKSLYGRDRKKYEAKGGPPANPLEMPGMCKHLIKTLKVLEQNKLF